MRVSPGLGGCVMRGLAVAVACVVSFTTSAAAEVVVNISKSSQRMAVLVDGSARYNWVISTGKRGFGTPNGTYRPQRLERSWYSRKFGYAPMPHSIFFYKGYAIHGTTEVARLGFIASHGCVRLHPENAAKLFALVQSQMNSTRITVSDKPIAPPAPPKSAPLVAENASPPPVVAVAKVVEIAAEPGMAKIITVPETSPMAEEAPAPRVEKAQALQLRKARAARAAEKTRPRLARFFRVARMDSRRGFHW